jgi:hypothetical protein
MKLMQKWGGIVQSLREADQLSPEQGIKQFDEAIERLEDVKRDKEKVYLLEDGLPEMMSVVLESRYLVGTFHRKITDLVQRALTFALDGLELSLHGSCKLVKDIFGHPHFEEIASQGLGADDAPNNGTGREMLTQSKRIRTYGRLNEFLGTFCDQKGYTQLLAFLSRPQLTLDETRSLMQVVATVATYLTTNAAMRLRFAKEANSRLISKIASISPHEVPIYLAIKDLIRQLLENIDEADLGLTPEVWRLALVAKLARELPVSLPVLWMQYPEKASQLVNLDPTKLQIVKDARSEFCKQTDLELDEVVFKTVVNGVIVKNHDDAHSITTMYVQHSHNVAYQVPVGWRRKYVQVLLTEGKPSPGFIPFYTYLRRKDLFGKHFYETIIPSAYLFTVKSMSEPPFTLKGISGASVVDVQNSTARLFPDASKGDSITIRIDWAETAESTSLRTNDLLFSKEAFAKRELLEALGLLAKQTAPLRTLLSKVQSGAKTTAELPLEVEIQPSASSHHHHHHKKDKKDKRKSGDSRKINDDTFDDPSLIAESSQGGTSKRSSSKRFSASSSSSSSLDQPISVAATFNQFFEGIVNLLNYCDLDISKAAIQLFHGFSSDTAMRDLLAIYTPVPKLSKNLLSPSLEVRQWSSLTLTFFGHDTFFYQRPTDQFESFEVRKTAPIHLNHRESEVLQFLYQVNGLRTVDPEFIEHASTEQLFWFLPLVFQTLQMSKITKEGTHANASLRSTVDLLLQKLQPLSYLRQFTLWLKYSSLIDEREFDLEWAIGSRFESTRSFFNSLAASMPNIEVGKKYTGLDIMDPMHDADGHNLPIAAVTVLKVFASKAKPCLLELFPADSKYPSKRVIFKKGDDLRQDLLVQACFYLFNVLWAQSDIAEKPFIHQYRLIPMGPDTGCVEFVQDSESLQTFSFEKMWPKYTDEDKSTLLRSAAGSYVAGWVMGVRDRHQDNMMVQHGNMFFHIDLGHIFNEKPTIDAPRFSIPTDLKESMSTQEWDRFKDICANGFKVLHRHAGLLINLICTMFRGVVDDMPKVRMFLTSPQSLMVGLEEKDATDKIRNLIDSGVTSVKKKGKYLIHTIFVGSNAKPSSAGPLSSAATKSIVDSQDGAFSDEAVSEPSLSPRKYSVSEASPREPRESEDRSSLAPPPSKRSSRTSSPRGSVSGDKDHREVIANSAPP